MVGPQAALVADKGLGDPGCVQVCVGSSGSHGLHLLADLSNQ